MKELINDAIVAVEEAQMFNADAERKSKRGIRRKRTATAKARKRVVDELVERKNPFSEKCSKKGFNEYELNVKKYHALVVREHNSYIDIAWELTDPKKAWRNRNINTIKLDAIDA